jgi:putative spermidine/putrescine transport system permease protein
MLPREAHSMVERRWTLLFLPSAFLMVGLLFATQGVFLRGSLLKDLGFGRFDATLQFGNFARIFSDPFYLHSLWLSVWLSAVASVIALLLAFPVAYILARMRSKLALAILAIVVATSFVSEVIKALGFFILFSANGPISQPLLALGIIEEPLRILGTPQAVIVGFLHFTLGIGILLLFGVVRTVPENLEEAAQIHGAPRWRVFWRVVLPLCAPGLLTTFLLFFNLCMGAFTSTAFLGGSRVMTLPLLIQRTIITEVKYGMGAALAATLLVSVILINLASVALIAGWRGRRMETA